MSISIGKRLLTVDELSSYLGRSKSSIYVMVYRGQIPYIKLGTGKNGSLRFDCEEIESFLETRKVGALPPVKMEAVNV